MVFALVVLFISMATTTAKPDTIDLAIVFMILRVFD